MMDAQETLERFAKFADALPTPGMIAELIAALARTDGVSEEVDETPGWSAFAPVYRTYVTEVGAERPKFWTAESPPMEEKIRTIRRWCMAPAAMGYSGVYLYKHGLMRTLGDPARTPRLAETISQLRDQLRGQMVDRAAELEDGTIWLRFRDGKELRA